MAHSRAWTFQDPKEIKRVGPQKAAWGVGWREPDGARRQKMCGPGSDGKKAAFRLQRRIEASLVSGQAIGGSSKSWKDFRAEFDETVLPTMSAENKRCIQDALGHFERLVHPRVVESISAKSIDQYVGARCVERGRKPGSTVSPATINKELRHLKSVLAYAVDWGDLVKMPSFKKRWQREPERLPRFVTPEHFSAIYGAADRARRPKLAHVRPIDWWRGLLSMAYMTGWRIDEILSLRRDDVNLRTGKATTRYQDNKGNRDDVAKLHQFVVDHLKPIKSFGELFFEWPHGDKALWTEFHRIQGVAGINLPCNENHKHTDSCHYYGFHDLRRAFATENAENVSAIDLQRLMRHKSFTTTLRYINMAKKTRGEPTDKLHVPDVRKEKRG